LFLLVPWNMQWVYFSFLFGGY